ncbi:hypothetical protein RF55_20926 [Lasius niger]|uniref:Uncharacterized protein n=1 Tax=Lasius niger TaxID=67767 RepID=A0A0J7JZ11_LASNI|nr:hypothetical protein RF55_20926 [Lasius niger]
MIRNRATYIINNLLSYASSHKDSSNEIRKLVTVTNKFLNQHPNLILTRADKGNVTVALDKDKYLNKVEDLLRDTETYTTLKKDPTRKLITQLRDILTR